MSGFNASNVDQRFGRAVRHQREALALGQEHVAELLRSTHGLAWHQTTVAKVELGSRPAKLSEAVALADVLGVELVALLGGAAPLEEQARAVRLQRQARQDEVERLTRFLNARSRELLSSGSLVEFWAEPSEEAGQ